MAMAAEPAKNDMKSKENADQEYSVDEYRKRRKEKERERNRSR